MTDQFEQLRSRLTAIAYGMLGSVMEAEDVVQDAFLRWQRVDPTTVEHPAAYLTTVTTRLAIDRLRSARHRRETYVGPWLPEPIVTDFVPDPADVVAEAEQLSLAFLTAMERLDPVERAVFLLRDVFDFEYDAIADIVDKSPANCRQIATRARQHVHRAPGPHPPDPTREAELLVAFSQALVVGDLEHLVAILTQDVIAWSDGGPNRRAARHPIIGIHRVSRFLTGIVKQGIVMGAETSLVRVNGEPAFRLDVGGELYGVMVFELVEGRINAIRTVLAPDKLRAAARNAR